AFFTASRKRTGNDHSVSFHSWRVVDGGGDVLKSPTHPHSGHIGAVRPRAGSSVARFETACSSNCSACVFDGTDSLFINAIVSRRMSSLINVSSPGSQLSQ